MLCNIPISTVAELIFGSNHEDNRGKITFNNDFDASLVKRVYIIENHSLEFIRGWQGHAIEQRWFASIIGSFEISVIELDNFDYPSKDLKVLKFILDSNKLNYLHVPAGCITAIKSLEEGSKLLALSDYGLGEINDERRFPIDYFINL